MTDGIGTSAMGFPATAVFGAGGFIGRALYGAAREGNSRSLGLAKHPMNGFDAFDLRRPDVRPLELERRKITHAVIAGGVTGLRACEENPRGTRAVNVTGTLELTRQLIEEGVKVVAFSSDHVFDGKEGGYDEKSPLNPLNEYGRQKAELETALPDMCGSQYLLLRLSKIYNLERGSGTLLDEMMGLMEEGRPVLAAADQVFCPTFLGDGITVVRALMESGASGLFNLCAPETFSRLEIARRAALTLEVPGELAREIHLTDLEESFTRPLDTSMTTARLASRIEHAFLTLDEALSALGRSYGKQ